MKCSFFLVLSVLAISACSTPQAAPKRLLECYIRFDQAQGTVLADAAMKTGDFPQQPAEIPGGIQYQATAMELLPVLGLTYRSQYPAGFVGEHIFRWNDERQKPEQFTMVMNPIHDFGFGGDSVWHNKPAVLKWDGPALEKPEVLMLMWEQEATHQTIPMELLAVGKGSEIEFPAAKMSALTPGKWTVYLIRKKLSKGTVGNTAYTCTAELYTRIHAITVL